MVSSLSDSNTRPPLYESALLPLSYACWEHFLNWICISLLNILWLHIYQTFIARAILHSEWTYISIYFSTFKMEHTVVNSYQNKLKKIRRKNWEWRLCTLYLLFHVYIHVRKRKAPKCTFHILSSKLQTIFCAKNQAESFEIGRHFTHPKKEALRKNTWFAWWDCYSALELKTWQSHYSKVLRWFYT